MSPSSLRAAPLLALIASAVLMLRHLAEKTGDESLFSARERIRAAYGEALSAGEKTRDLGGELGTREFADALIARMR